MNARHALERQWAALVVRRPAARHVLLKWLRAYGIEAHWFTFEDAQAAAIYRAVQRLVYTNQPVTVDAVAADVGAHDFSLTEDEAYALVAGLVDALPSRVDADRLALATLQAVGITFPEPDVTDYLADPYGRRADVMQARKARHAR